MAQAKRTGGFYLNAQGNPIDADGKALSAEDVLAMNLSDAELETLPEAFVEKVDALTAVAEPEAEKTTEETQPSEEAADKPKPPVTKKATSKPAAKKAG